MSKLLAAVFCCSSHTKDNINKVDTVYATQKKRNQSSQRHNGVMSDKARDQKDGGVTCGNRSTSYSKNKKELLDEENSINETETMTNTNEEVNNSPAQGGHEEQQDDSLAHKVTEVATAKEKSEQIGTPDVGEAGGIGEEPAGDDDNRITNLNEEGAFDLSKFQEGQLYDKKSGWLLPDKNKKFSNKKCLVLDLDETLVHSSFRYLRYADFVIPVEIDNQIHHVYVIKRPGIDEFLHKVGQWFEVVVFTASVLKYGDALLDRLDHNRSIHHRLFRESCYNYEGNYIKNLSQLGRPLEDSIIIDNSPASYIFHPQHSIPISSWFNDSHDSELTDLLPFLEDISKSNVDDVSLVLDVSI